jgi:hypothetical protein
MRADQVLIEHHNVLRALCKEITGTPAGSAEREERVNDLIVELDIHMRIEDDLFYPAVAAASTLVAVAHAEHRQVSDRLAGFLRTNPTDAAYEGEWQAFVTTLDAHAEEEERDLFPPACGDERGRAGRAREPDARADGRGTDFLDEAASRSGQRRCAAQDVNPVLSVRELVRH